jgi:hypothetical protein
MENTVDRLQWFCETLLRTLNLPTTPTYTMALAFIVLTLVGFSDLVLWLLSFIVGRMVRYIENGFRAGRTWDEGRPGRLRAMPIASLPWLYQNVWGLLKWIGSWW